MNVKINFFLFFKNFDLNGTAESGAKIPYKLATSGSEGLICEALLTGNITAAVELCMSAGRSTDAMILATLGGSELLARTQYRYLKGNDSFISNLISAMVMADWSGVISQCTIDSWKEALVAALTHSREQSPLLCERLGERLQIESEGDQSIVKNSILCYICAGNIERIVDAWSAVNGTDATEDSEKLQELVEVVVLLSKAMERQGKNVAVYGKYAELLSKYASLLAAQGSLDMALTYIGTSQDDANIIELRERLYFALGHKQQNFAQKTNQPNFNAPRLSHPRTISASSTSAVPPNAFNTGLPNAAMAFNNHFDQNAWSAAPAAVSKPPPAMMNPADVLQQPPRPASVSSVGSASQPAASLPKPKRLLDPSVQSGPSYGQVPGPSPMFGGAPAQSTMYSGAPATSTMYGGAPAFNTNPIQQISAPFPPQPMNSMNPVTQQPSMGWDQPNYGYQNNSSNMNGSLPPPPTAQMLRNPTPPPGWNDPPEFKAKAQVRPSAAVSLHFSLHFLLSHSVQVARERNVGRTRRHEKVASKARGWSSRGLTSIAP